MAEAPVKRPKVAWSDDLSHDSAEERGRTSFTLNLLIPCEGPL